MALKNINISIFLKKVFNEIKFMVCTLTKGNGILLKAMVNRDMKIHCPLQLSESAFISIFDYNLYYNNDYYIFVLNLDLMSFPT